MVQPMALRASRGETQMEPDEPPELRDGDGGPGSPTWLVSHGRELNAKSCTVRGHQRSAWGPPPTLIILCLLFFKNKETHRRRVQIFGYQRWVDGWNWTKAVKRYKLPVIRKVSTRDVIYNTAIYYT